MPEGDLLVLLADWQKRLGLADWKIHLRLIHQHELGRADGGAEIEISNYRRRAVLKLVRYEERSHDFLDANDDEFLVLHELLHVVLCGFAPDEESVAEEQAVNALAECLLKLKRQRVD